MQTGLAAASIFLVSLQAAAQTQYSLQPRADGVAAPAPLLGVWGTAEQCTAFRAERSDHPALLPYELSEKWIRQGYIYCYLRWQFHRGDANVLSAGALAQCGEDSLREYRLALSLRRERLTIRWSGDFTTGELRNCRQRQR